MNRMRINQRAILGTAERPVILYFEQQKGITKLVVGKHSYTLQQMNHFCIGNTHCRLEISKQQNNTIAFSLTSTLPVLLVIPQEKKA